LSYIIVTLDTVKVFVNFHDFFFLSVFKYFSTLKQQTIEQLFKHFGGPLPFRTFWHCGKRIH